MALETHIEKRLTTLKVALEARDALWDKPGAKRRDQRVQDALNALFKPVWDEGYREGNSDGGITIWDPRNPYESK